MMQQNNCMSSSSRSGISNPVITSGVGSLSNRGIVMIDNNSSSMQLDAFVQQHLLSNNVSQNVSQNCSPARYQHPIIKSPLQQQKRQYCQTALGDINNNIISNNQSPNNKDNHSVTDKYNQENYQHFYSVIDKTSDILMQSPSKHNDKQTVYKSFTHSPSPTQQSRNNLRNLEDSSSYHNNILNSNNQNNSIQVQQQLSINQSLNQQINDSFCNTQSPKKINKQKDSNNDINNNNNGSQRKTQSPFKRQQKVINDENSIDTQKQSPTFHNSSVTTRKSVVLEQENQNLKNQIEMLKAALLGLCQNQKLDIPEIIPLITNNNVQTIKENIQQENKHEISTNENNQVTNTEDCYQTKQVKSTEHIEEPVANNSICSSPSKSIKRRNRAQRQQNQQQSPAKNKDTTTTYQSNNNNTISYEETMQLSKNKDDLIRESSDDICSDLPLQIQYRRTATVVNNQQQQQQQQHPTLQNHLNDDTMVMYDKSMDNQQHLQQLQQQQNHNDIKDNSDTLNNNCSNIIACGGQQQQYQNDDSIMMVSQIQTNYNEINDNQQSFDISMRDQSQIQIKYAKMLEELEENEVSTLDVNNLEYSPNNNENKVLIDDMVVQDTRDTATFLGVTQGGVRTFDMVEQRKQYEDKQQQNDLELLPQQCHLMETMKSNKYEYQQFYENELNQLKSELEMFENEEKQLLNLFIQPIEQNIQEQQHNSNQQLKQPNKQLHKASTLQEQSPSKRLDIVEQIDQNGSIMNNLREAFLELKDVLQDQHEEEDEDLIRPVRILSPVQQLKVDITYQSNQCSNYLATDNSEAIHQQEKNFNLTSPPNKQFYPVTSQSVLSCEKQNISTLNSHLKQTPLIDKNSIIFKMQKEYSNFKSSQKSLHNAFNPLSTSNTHQKPSKNQSCFKNDKKPTQQQLDKSPSMVSLQNYKYTTDIDHNSRSTTPIRERLRSESRLRKQQQSALNKLKMSSTKHLDNSCDINVENVDCVPTVEAIELLAKRKSLAIGLKQQEEPSSDNDDDKTNSNYDYTNQNSLRIIKPVLMDQPSFDSKCDNQDEKQLSCDPEEVRIELANDNHYNKSIDTVRQDTQNKDTSPSYQYQSYFDGECSTGLMREKQNVQTLIENTKHHVKSTQDKFFGQYSKEQSEKLKYQRQESIKRAEELLTDLIRDRSIDSQKRPSCLGSPKKDLNTTSSMDQREYTPKRLFQQQQNSNRLQPILQQSQEFNDLSFQENQNHNQNKKDKHHQHQNKLRESTRESLMSSSACGANIEVINLQISPDRQTVDYHHEMSNCVSPYTLSTKIDMKLQQFDAFNQTYNSVIGTTDSNQKQQNHTSRDHQTIDSENYNNFDKPQFINYTPSQFEQTCVQSQFSNQKDNQKMISPISDKHYTMLEPQIINRRKSLETTIISNSKMYHANQQSNPKRRTLQLKKGGMNNKHNQVQQMNDSQHNQTLYNTQQKTKDLYKTTISTNSGNSIQVYNNQKQQSVNNKSSNTQHSTYQQFHNGSQSCEKSKTRKTGSNTMTLSKTLENLRQHEDTQFNHSNVYCNQTGVFKVNQVEEPIIIAYPQKMSTIDAEAFYMERSKSVVKRREELQKKKQQEIQNKIEAKNMRIQQFKNTRNSQLNTSHGRVASNLKYSNAVNHGTDEIMQNNSYQNIKSSTQYHSKQRSIDSRSITPTKSSQDKSQRVSHLAVKQYESITQLNNTNTQNNQKPTQITRQKSLGKCQIKFEKRTQDYKMNPTIQTSNTKSDLYNQTAILNLQTPNNDNFSNNNSLQQINPGTISSKSVQNISVIPSSQQSKTNTKITSECSTFRRQQNLNCGIINASNSQTIEFNDSQTQKSQGVNQSMNVINGKVNSNNFQQRKGSQGSHTHSFKQNIINRTMRIGQQKPKEYVQLKQEHKMKQIMMNTLENNNQSQSQAQMNQTLHSSQMSEVINYKQHQNTALQQPQIINKSKALTKNFIQNLQQTTMIDNKKLQNSKSASKLTNNHSQLSSNNFQIQPKSTTSSIANSNYNTQQRTATHRPGTVVEYNQNETICFTDKKKQNNLFYVQDLSMQLSQVLSSIGKKENGELQLIDSNRSPNRVKDRKSCQNCIRLMSKGLSTDFCLEHYNTPRCIDE